MEKKIAIVGFGWVGKAMYELFPDAVVYSQGYYRKGNYEAFRNPDFLPGDIRKYKRRINRCDIAFVCVPTPCPSEGKLDTSIVEEVVSWCKCPLIVIRSTVNPGTADYLIDKYNKKILVQPEYLGETPSHPMLDPKTRPFLVIGGESYKDRRTLIDLYTTVYNANVSIRQMSNYEAEVVKMSENRAIAYKVAECQELYDVCEKAGIDYYVIREAVYNDDPRFNLWWSFIYPEKRGFNSKCIPKDVYAWCAFAESLGYNPSITRAILEKNKQWISQS